MSATSIAELMNPKRLDAQARYENERVGISQAWGLAARRAYVSEKKVVNAKGETNYIESTFDEDINEVSRWAHALAPLITADLNAALTKLGNDVNPTPTA